jgi:hypothetical protein
MSDGSNATTATCWHRLTAAPTAAWLAGVVTLTLMHCVLYGSRCWSVNVNVNRRRGLEVDALLLLAHRASEQLLAQGAAVVKAHALPEC